MAIAYQELATDKNSTREARTRNLSCAMRCYVTITNFRGIISRGFIAEALKGIEHVKVLQSSE